MIAIPANRANRIIARIPAPIPKNGLPVCGPRQKTLAGFLVLVASMAEMTHNRVYRQFKSHIWVLHQPSCTSRSGASATAARSAILSDPVSSFATT